MPASASDRVQDWVRPDEGRVLGRMYTDPEVFELEIRRI